MKRFLYSTLLAVVFTFALRGQTGSITNTLGASGLFTIKDASNNYFTLSQSTGQVNILRTLRLENTSSSTVGVIFKGADRFLHNYGTENTFMGINSGNFTMTGIKNLAFGGYSLNSNTTGNFNLAIGGYSLNSNTTGDGNIALGYESMYDNSTGLYNIAVGYQALWSNNGDNNTALGTQSLYSNITGYENTSVGNYSSYANSNGYRNTALGYRSMYNNNTGYYNTAVGYYSLNDNTAGTRNTGVGYESLRNTFGSLNTALGFSAGISITSGSNLTCVGNNAQPTVATATNQITLGDGFVTLLRCNVTTISSLSDVRDKKNITDLSLGLDFISKLKPRLFHWDRREWYDNNTSDGSKMKKAPTAGFIAQELDAVQNAEHTEWLNLVLKDNPDKLEATPGNLLPIMVKAIQELNIKSHEKAQQLARLTEENKELKRSLTEVNERMVQLDLLVKSIDAKVASK